MVSLKILNAHAGDDDLNVPPNDVKYSHAILLMAPVENNSFALSSCLLC